MCLCVTAFLCTSINLCKKGFALIPKNLAPRSRKPLVVFVLLAASLETRWPRFTLTPEFRNIEALAGWTSNWLPSYTMPLFPDVTVGPIAKFAISRLLLGMSTVIWFCIGLSYNNSTDMASGSSGSFKTRGRWDCRVLQPISVANIFLRFVSSSWPHRDQQ